MERDLHVVRGMKREGGACGERCRGCLVHMMCGCHYS